MALHAYRFFSGTCREAMTRYQTVFGGELEVMTYAELPPGEDGMPGADPNMVMHAALVFPDGAMLMASDDPTGDGAPAKGVALHHGAATVEEGERIFNELAAGGEVQMPFEPTFWAQRFGACVDRFGTSWMVSVDHPDPKAT
ncbi:MAG: VOC family protein [Vicinamibacterales bacterium]